MENEKVLGKRLREVETELSEKKSRQEQQAQDSTLARTEGGAVTAISESEFKRNVESESIDETGVGVEIRFNAVTAGRDIITHAHFHQATFKPREYPLLKQLVAKEPATWNLPRHDNVFVGRKNLLDALHVKLNPANLRNEKLMEIKEQDEGQRTVLAINACAGLGGVGKTQLALEYIHQTKHKYNLKAWFSAENINQLQQQYLEFARDLGYEDEKSDIKEAIKHIKLCLIKYPGWLLVYDNVEKYEKIADFLPNNGGNVLITSRNQKWPDKVGHVSINVMDEAEAICLVKTLSGRDDAEIKDLAAILGYLPLALAQASAYIREKGKTVAEYLALYKQYEAKLLADKTLPEGANHAPVAVTWNVSLDAVEIELKEASTPPLAHALMTVCAYFAPENIPRTVLLGWLQSNYPNIEAHELVLDEVLAQLRHYSLITLDVTKQNISIHRLVQTVLKHQIQVKKVFDVDVVGLTENWYKHVLEAIHQKFGRGKTVLEIENQEMALFPHLQILESYYNEVIKSPEKAFDLARANVLRDIGLVFLNRLGDPKAANSLLERALRIEEQHYGRDQPGVAITLCSLGNVHYFLGNVKEAGVLYKRVLKIQEQAYGNESSELVGILMNLATACSGLGDLNEAKALYERALNIEKKRLAPEHYSANFAATLGNLGNIYLELGDVGQAKTLFKQALKIEEQFYGSSHPRVAIRLTCLGCLYSKLKDASQAKALYERALDIQEQCYGSGHYSLAITLINLGMAYHNLGNTKKSKELYKRAYEIQEKHYGSEHYNVADTLYRLVKLHIIANEQIIAYPLAERCYNIYLKKYGAGHKDTQDAADLLQVCQAYFDLTVKLFSKIAIPLLLSTLTSQGTDDVFKPTSKEEAQNKDTKPPKP